MSVEGQGNRKMEGARERALTDFEIQARLEMALCQEGTERS